MKAVVYTEYGNADVLKYTDVEKPVPKDNQVLIKVKAVSLNAADWHIMRADPFMARLYSGLFKPKFSILGADIAGTVESAGKDVTQFKAGDDVYGEIALHGFGGLAEYVCTAENVIAHKPAKISFEEAAAIPMAAMTALQGLRDLGKVKSGQKVLINGASGGVGTFAVQIAKMLGAVVTAVCSTGNMEQSRALGADFVIDYKKEDFTKNGQQYDLILGANGYQTLQEYKRSLADGGTYIMSGGTGGQMFQAMLLGPWFSIGGKKRILALSASSNQKILTEIKEFVESGKIKPVIDRKYQLSETVNAMRYLEEGHAKGKIVITVQ